MRPARECGRTARSRTSAVGRRRAGAGTPTSRDGAQRAGARWGPASVEACDWRFYGPPADGLGSGRPPVSCGFVTEADNLPAWTGRRGTYEVWFLTVTDPATGAGYWIRSTLTAPKTGVP